MDNASLAFQRLTPDDIIHAIEAQGYDCNGSLLALNSYENRVYQVGIEDQPPLIAKFYRPARWPDAAIIEEHQFTQALAMDDIPVIAPLSNAQQATLHTHQHFRFALYPRQGGHTPALDNSEHLSMIGRFIARIHLHGAQADYQYRPELNVQNFAIIPANYLLEHDCLPSTLISPYRHLLDDLLAKIHDHFQAAGKISLLRIHGDCHPSNILWREDKPHIVDFDDTRMGPAIQDLWLFLSGERPYRNARLYDLLDGYTLFRDFNPRELHLIEPLRTLRIIHYAAWLAQRADDPAFSLAFPWFYTARFWDEHILNLKEQSAALDEVPLVWD